MKSKPHKFRDGEMVPVIGGIHDGAVARVSVLFPFLDGGLPNALTTIDGSVYRLDQVARCYRPQAKTRGAK